MALVIDASVAMGWLLPSQADALTIAAETTLEEDLGWISNHFVLEVARTLRNRERRNLLTPQAVDEALARLRDMPLQQDIDDALTHVSDTAALARQHGLRIADAGYLELALRIDLPLATRDRKLAMAAANAGARLFAP